MKFKEQGINLIEQERDQRKDMEKATMNIQRGIIIIIIIIIIIMGAVRLHRLVENDDVSQQFFGAPL